MNIIFTISRAWQLLIADAYAKYIYDSYKIKSIFIIYGFDPMEFKANYAETIKISNKHGKKIARAWQRLLHGGWLFPFSKISKGIDFNIKSLFFVFCDLDPIPTKIMNILIKKNPHNKVVLIEEGIGTYSITELKKKVKFHWLRNSITWLLGSQNQVRAIGDNPLISYAVVDNVERYKGLEKSKSQIVLQRSIENVLASAKDFVGKFLGNQCKYNNDEVEVVYLGQPLAGYGKFTKIEEACIKHVFEMFPKDIKFLIKPHPAEELNKYAEVIKEFDNAVLIDSRLNDVPVECLISSINPRYIVSYFSSAGMNLANRFPNMKAVFLYKLGSIKEIDFGRYASSGKINDEIFISPHNNTYVPKTDSEFAEVFKKCEPLAQENEETISGDKYPEIDAIMQEMLMVRENEL